MRSIRLALPLLCFAGLLASCDGDGDDTRRISFGIEGRGTCDEVVMEVDLEGAFAILDRDDGVVNCAAAAVIDNDCDVTFEEVSDGDVLRVRITGCQIDSISELFDCRFDKVDLAFLQTRVDAQCSCITPRCDELPATCAAPSDDPFFCEDCANGEDDDQDRLVDCQDPNCRHSFTCESTTTSSSTQPDGTIPPSTIPTTTTESTTTTTLATTTTTTLPPDTTTTTTGDVTTTTTGGSGTYIVTFRLATAAAALGAMQLTIDYAAAPGEFRGSGPAVVCTTKISGALGANNDIDGERKLNLGMISLTAFSAPVDLFDCTFDGSPSDPPVPADFGVTVSDATDPDGNQIAATATASVNAVP